MSEVIASETQPSHEANRLIRRLHAWLDNNVVDFRLNMNIATSDEGFNLAQQQLLAEQPSILIERYQARTEGMNWEERVRITKIGEIALT